MCVVSNVCVCVCVVCVCVAYVRASLAVRVVAGSVCVLTCVCALCSFFDCVSVCLRVLCLVSLHKQTVQKITALRACNDSFRFSLTEPEKRLLSSLLLAEQLSLQRTPDLALHY